MAARFGWSRVVWVVLEGGTLTRSDVRSWPACWYCRGPLQGGWGVERGSVWVRGFVGTLLGPEGADPARCCRAVVARRRRVGAFLVPGPSWSYSAGPLRGVGLGAAGGVVAGCWLRTAQWTRAS